MTESRQRLPRLLGWGLLLGGLFSLLGSALLPGLGHPRAVSAALCPMTSERENIAIARTWHEEVINRRNPAVQREILAPEVVHHAAGGYPDTMTAEQVIAMMEEFLAAFSDLRYHFDLFVVQGDTVVERYTATGTQDGPFQDLAPSGRRATWTGINIFRIKCGEIVEVWSEVDALTRRQQLTAPTGADPGS